MLKCRIFCSRGAALVMTILSELRSKITSVLLCFLFCSLLPLCLSPSLHAAPKQQIEAAIQRLHEKDYVKALELFHAVEERIANPDELSGYLAVAYLGRGYQLLAANRFVEARKSFLEGRRYNDQDPRLWQGEAMCLYRQGQYAEAAAHLEQAIGTVSGNAELYHLLGRAYYAEGRMPEAVDSLERSRDLGGGEKVATLLEKAAREWKIEMEMEREVRGHFQLSFVDGPNTSNLASEIIDTLEEAYADLGSDLAYYPDVTVPVLLYSKMDFSVITRSPDWAGGVYDGKIRLPLGGIHKISEPLKAILYHEYAHVLLHFMANRNLPVWLNEGLAEKSGRRIHSPPLEHLHKAVEEKRLLEWETLEVSFAKLADERVPLAYQQSFSMVDFLIENYGWHKLADLLTMIGRKKPWQEAMGEVYSDYGLDWPAIRAEWQTSLGM